MPEFFGLHLPNVHTRIRKGIALPWKRVGDIVLFLDHGRDDNQPGVYVQRAGAEEWCFFYSIQELRDKNQSVENAAIPKKLADKHMFSAQLMCEIYAGLEETRRMYHPKEKPRYECYDFENPKFVGNGANTSVFMAKNYAGGVVVIMSSRKNYRWYDDNQYCLDPHMAEDAEEDGVTLCPLTYALAFKAMREIKNG